MQFRGLTSSRGSSFDSHKSKSAKLNEFYAALSSLKKLQQSTPGKGGSQKRQRSFDSSEQIFEKKRQIVMLFSTSPDVCQLPEYVQLWLSLVISLENPEEGFAYLIAQEIGLTEVEFYRTVMEFYIERFEFVLAFQVLEFCKERMPKNDEQIQLKLKELEQVLEKAEDYALWHDFYQKGLERIDIGDTTDAALRQSSLKAAPSISEKEFTEIKNIDFKKRMNQFLVSVLGQNFLETDDSSGTADTRRKQKSHVRQLQSTTENLKSRKTSKKYSDLINTVIVNGSTIYVGRECRAAIPKYKRRAYEYAFLSKLYPTHCAKTRNSTSGQEKRIFWIKLEYKQKIEEIFKSKLHQWRKKSGKQPNPAQLIHSHATAPTENLRAKRNESLNLKELPAEPSKALDLSQTLPAPSIIDDLKACPTLSNFEVGETQATMSWEDAMPEVPIIKQCVESVRIPLKITSSTKHPKKTKNTPELGVSNLNRELPRRKPDHLVERSSFNMGFDHL